MTNPLSFKRPTHLLVSLPSSPALSKHHYLSNEALVRQCSILFPDSQIQAAFWLYTIDNYPIYQVAVALGVSCDVARGYLTRATEIFNNESLDDQHVKEMQERIRCNRIRVYNLNFV